jgi:hypothetical protein
MKGHGVALRVLPDKGWSLPSRLASSAVGIPLLVLLTWYGNPALAAVVASVSFLAALELFTMAKRAGAAPVWLALLYAPTFAINAWRGAPQTEAVVTGALLLPLLWLLFRFQGARSFQSMLCCSGTWIMAEDGFLSPSLALLP